jgi:type IV secretory pathway VirB6-like protein
MDLLEFLRSQKTRELFERACQAVAAQCNKDSRGSQTTVVSYKTTTVFVSYYGNNQ